MIKAKKTLKICTSCNQEFIANSGNALKCQICKKCKECNKLLKYSHQQFCGHVCSGKYLFKNNINNTFKDNFSKLKIEHRSRGKNHYNWQGGITKERKKLMSTLEYKNWRKNVFEKDNYTCQICFKFNCYLEADHIIPYCINKVKALDLNNGRTLCLDCHRKTSTWGIKALQYKEI